MAHSRCHCKKLIRPKNKSFKYSNTFKEYLSKSTEKEPYCLESTLGEQVVTPTGAGRETYRGQVVTPTEAGRDTYWGRS